MQTAPPQATGRGPNEVEVPERRRVVRRGPRPATIAIATIVTAIAIGSMLLPILGLWPLQFGETVSAPPTPVSPYVAGLLVEKAGQPRIEGDQVFVNVKVTNNVKIPAAVVGTPTPNAPTPTPEAVDLYNGTVKVIFYSGPSNDPKREIVGSAIGNVTDLKPGESKEIEVVGTGIGRFCEGCFEVYPDTVWTERDVAAPSGTPAP